MIAKKRGLSPVIATVLLIAIAFVLAAIIFLWARGFLAEKLQKDLGDGAEPIEVACEQVDADADAAFDGTDIIIDVINRGNVPLYAIAVKNKKRGSLTLVKEEPYLFDRETSLLSGESDSVKVTSLTPANVSDALVVVPVILGEVGEQHKGYPCEKKSIIIEKTAIT